MSSPTLKAKSKRKLCRNNRKLPKAVFKGKSTDDIKHQRATEARNGRKIAA